MRLVGYPDAAYRNNVDNTSQRGRAIFLAEEGNPSKKRGVGSLVDFESQKMTEWFCQPRLLSSIRSKCFGTCHSLRGLWMDVSTACVAIHMRADANNLVTPASTTRLPKQKEAIHMIRMLRKAAFSGQTEGLAHVASTDCLSDCLTKSSAKPDAFIKAVST